MTEGSTGTAPPETIVRPSIHWVDERLVSITRARGDCDEERNKKAFYFIYIEIFASNFAV